MQQCRLGSLTIIKQIRKKYQRPGREPDRARLSTDRVHQRSRRQHHTGQAGHLRDPPAAPRPGRSATPVRVLLGRRQPHRRPPRPRTIADGPRLRVGDLNDAPAGPASGEGLQARRAGWLRVWLRAGLSRVDNEGPDGDRPHRPSPDGDCGEGRAPLRDIYGWRDQALEKVIAWDGRSWDTE